MSVLRVELRVSEERESGELKTQRESAGVLSFFRGRVQLQSVWCDANVERNTRRERRRVGEAEGCGGNSGLLLTVQPAVVRWRSTVLQMPSRAAVIVANTDATAGCGGHRCGWQVLASPELAMQLRGFG